MKYVLHTVELPIPQLSLFLIISPQLFRRIEGRARYLSLRQYLSNDSIFVPHPDDFKILLLLFAVTHIQVQCKLPFASISSLSKPCLDQANVGVLSVGTRIARSFVWQRPQDSHPFTPSHGPSLHCLPARMFCLRGPPRSVRMEEGASRGSCK